MVEARKKLTVNLNAKTKLCDICGKNEEAHYYDGIQN
jgi:hypothetical protein